MKAKITSIIAVAGLAVILAGGCREIKTTTTIFPNGSCERIVTVEGDSSEIADRSFPVPRDPSWSIDLKTENDKLIQTAKKKFRSVADLNDELRTIDEDTLQVNIRVVLQKRFRWFNTFYTYRESYESYNPYPWFPISDYMSEEELAIYYINEDSLDLDDKMDEWAKDNIFEEFIHVLLENAESAKIPNLTTEWIRSKRDTLYHYLWEMDTEEFVSDEVLQICENVLETTAIWEFKDSIEKIGQQINEKNEFLFSPLMNTGFENNVIMPGLIIATNAKTVEGNRVSWDIEGKFFLWENYEMWIESRVINRWALWTSILLFLGIASLLTIASIRKRQP